MTKLYELLGKEKGRTMHCLNFKTNLKMYQVLTFKKIDLYYQYKYYFKNIDIRKILTFLHILEEYCHI